MGPVIRGITGLFHVWYTAERSGRETQKVDTKTVDTKKDPYPNG